MEKLLGLQFGVRLREVSVGGGSTVYDKYFFRMVLNQAPKVIRTCLSFVVRLCDWFKKIKILRHFLNESEVKIKPIVTCSLAFSRA